MNELAAVIEPALDIEEIDLAIDEENIAVRDAEENLEQHRLELGRLLCVRRKTYPARAKDGEPKWDDYLKEKSIPQQRSSESMELYRKSLLPDSGNSNDADETEPDPPFHILIDAAKLKDRVRRIAQSWPEPARAHVPELLRDLANELERESC